MLEKAIFAAGCFWGVEEAFRSIKGVTETSVGYIGGSSENPTYEEVCGKNTGHAEAVEVTFNNEETSYQTLLDTFWKIHDPTEINRQGPDIGEQYRSEIFYLTDEQRELAEESKEKLMSSLDIATKITKAPTFFKAEEYHQKYIMKKGGGSCIV